MAINFSAEDREILLPALATCANDCYLFDKKLDLEQYATELEEYRVEENGENDDGTTEAQYTVYKLTVWGKHHGKLLLAIRGTWTLQTILQDLSLLDLGQVLTQLKFGRPGEQLGWERIRWACDHMIEVAERIKPDLITGHSLGGLLAEVVATYTRIPGIVFNSPGPVGLINETPLYNKNKEYYKGLQFEVHLRENDPVSQLNYEWHINSEPIWHPGAEHGSDYMAMDIQRDYSTVMTDGALIGIVKPLLCINKRQEETKHSWRIFKWIFRNESGCCRIL